MTRRPRSSFLDEATKLLVEHFGVNSVRASLARVSNGAVGLTVEEVHRTTSRPSRKVNPSIVSLLDQLRSQDEIKHRLLSDFFSQLTSKKALPESQDIRYFAQLIGIKDIAGKSRKAMVPKLMRFMIELPIERLRVDIERAASVSEQQRRRGYSVLTDMILGDE